MDVWKKLQLISGLSKWKPGENPLSVLGFTEFILEQKWSDDDIWDIVKKNARTLVVKFRTKSELQGDTTVKEQVVKYTDAFQLLNNRETFLEALAELRTEKSHHRSALIDAQRTAKELREQLISTQEKLEALTITEKDLKKALGSQGFLATMHTRFQSYCFPDEFFDNPGIKFRTMCQNSKLLTIRFEIDCYGGTRVNEKKVFSELTKELGVVSWEGAMKSTKEILKDNLRNYKLGTESADDLIENALNQSSHPDQPHHKEFPTIQWDEEEWMVRNGVLKKRPKASLLKVDWSFLKDLKHWNLTELQCSDLYRSGLRVIQRLLYNHNAKLVRQLRIYPQIVNIKEGIAEHRRNKSKVMGTMEKSQALEGIYNTVLYTDFSITEQTFLNSPTYPFLFPGSFLITTTQNLISGRYSNADTILESLTNKAKSRAQFYEMRNLIIAVA